MPDTDDVFMPTREVLVRSLALINERGLAKSNLEDCDGKVCTYGAMRIVLGYSNDVETDPTADNFPFDNYHNADYALKRAIPREFKPELGHQSILWEYNDEKTEEEVKGLFQRAIDSLEA